MKANDIAVGVESIQRAGLDRFAPVLLSAACHHLNYFTSVAGQAQLKRVAWGAPVSAPLAPATA